MPPTIAPDDALPDAKWLLPDPLWESIKPFLPPEKPKPRGGRPRVAPRRTMDAIFYVLRTGCQWKALPRSLGSASTAHRYFQRWLAAGVFEKLWRLGLDEYDSLKGIQWKWQALDGAMTKAPLGARRLARTPRIGRNRARSANC